MDTLSASRAIVRGVPSSFVRALRDPGSTAVIDVEVARRQHQHYCAGLEFAGLNLIRIPADERYPDCCFVEDTAIVVGNQAIITRPGAPTRRGETAAVAQALSELLDVSQIRPPSTLDGGDVLRIGGRLYVGLSGRTNSEAVGHLESLLAPQRTEVVPVELEGVLHLKSACTHLGGDTVVWWPAPFSAPPFSRLRRITVPDEEAHAANCLSVNGVVFVPSCAPRTRELIEAAGYSTVELDISETRKAAGGLTCCSIIF